MWASTLVYLHLEYRNERFCESLWLRVHMEALLCGDKAIQGVKRGDEDKAYTRSINNLRFTLYFEIGIRSLLVYFPSYLLVGHEKKEEALGSWRTC